MAGSPKPITTADSSKRSNLAEPVPSVLAPLPDSSAEKRKKKQGTTDKNEVEIKTINQINVASSICRGTRGTTKITRRCRAGPPNDRRLIGARDEVPFDNVYYTDVRGNNVIACVKLDPFVREETGILVLRAHLSWRVALQVLFWRPWWTQIRPAFVTTQKNHPVALYAIHTPERYFG